MADYQLFSGDCREFLPSIPSASVDLVLSDPPYPCIKRDYGMMSEADWLTMMQEVVQQTRRILKPSGSAVFILQPNSEKVGKMRLWLWKFMVWCGEEWNIVQDAYWWNISTMPQTSETIGLMRSSAKPCVWIGEPNCYRNQSGVLWDESMRNAQQRLSARAQKDTGLKYYPSGVHVRKLRTAEAAERRGGVTPFNVLPIPNANSVTSAGAHGHGAGTPQALTDWWTRYLCPPGGVVADWFCGTGTTGLSAAKYGNSFIGCEKMPQYYAVSNVRLGEAYSQTQPALLEVA